MSETMQSDRRIGLTIVLGIVALAGSGAMVVGHGEPLAAYGFAAAMLAGTLLVAALHAYE